MHLEAGLEHCPTGAGTVRGVFLIHRDGFDGEKGEKHGKAWHRSSEHTFF